MHTKGYVAPETKATFEQARFLIEQARALGEPLEDPLLLFSVLYGFWYTNLLAFNGDALRELSMQFLALAQKQTATIPLMLGHRLVGTSLLFMGENAESLVHHNQMIALYDPTEHRPLMTCFGQDLRVAILAWRAVPLWSLGYPALADARDALKKAREIGHAATLMYALCFTTTTLFRCGNYAAANLQVDELLPLADEKGAVFWKAHGMCIKGVLSALSGDTSNAIHMLTSGIDTYRSTGSTASASLYLSYLARAYADVGQFDHAWRCIGEAVAAVEATKETWNEADTRRIAGEIALMSVELDTAKAEAYFEHSLAVARKQQAKSLELRAAMSIARLWREQGKPQQARELLAPVYGWFTEGFDTLDLKEAKALLEALT
jgi:predicted ATPase